MAEWFVGPVMDKIINACFDYLQDQVSRQTGMKEALKNLRENHLKIQAVVFASAQAQIGDQNNQAFNKWIWQLRDAIDEAEDLFDEFEYMKHKQQLITNMEETETKKRKGKSIGTFIYESAREIARESARKFRKVGERGLKIDPNLNRLVEVVQNLDKISAEVGTFLHLLETTKQEQQKQQIELHKARETGALPKNDLIGRGKEKEYVMQWLRKPSDENQTTLYKNISLLSIVGHGGMGKTTLLQHVYEDETTKLEFDLKMWVCVSNDDFNVKRVITDMLESLKNERPRLESLHTLQESLRSTVMSKKFLLVLDDIWEEQEDRDQSKWENVLAPLAYGSLGSKILMTTRMNSAAFMIARVLIKQEDIIFRLTGLEEDESLQLLKSHAFANVKNPDDYHKLRSIAGDIVKKLSGSPLAAKVIGGVLNSSLDENHWIRVLNSAQLDQNDILPILRLSYVYLPKPLQNCFTFCCIFAQDYEFDKDDLVRMWIALGFIQPPFNSGENMEDIGGRYFDSLIKKSFFDKFGTELRIYYKMHDLLHELAQSVSTQECLRVVCDDELPSRIPKTIRHLSVQTSNLEVLRRMKKFKYLRSFFLIYEGKSYNAKLVAELAEVFKASRSIRLLDIYSAELKIIPETIEYLIHLRYFKFNQTGYSTLDQIHDTPLPKFLCNLYHLQFIIYRTPPNNHLYHLFPRNMNSLSNLRYLEFPTWHYENEFLLIPGIGKLRSLQNLKFNVMDMNDYRICELEHMNELRKLKIVGLGNVSDPEEVCSAKLYDKRNLSELSLDLCGGNIYHEKILDNLQPHKNLKKLRIKAYMGGRSTVWMNNADLIFNLEYINLTACLELKTLPAFGQLPFLKSLFLHNMPKVKQLENKFHGCDRDSVFPSLEKLQIQKLQVLEDWFDATAAADDRLFPCLIELQLSECPNLLELPSLPPKLKILKINKIGWTALKGKQGTSKRCSISKSTPLETLWVHHCPNITYISLADEIARHAALRCLEILDCPNLISLGGLQEVETTDNYQLRLSKLSVDDPSVLLMEPLRSITFLEELEILNKGELLSFPIEAEQWFLQVSASLSKLVFRRLRSVPSSLESLSSLKELHVKKVPQLQLLLNIPTSLVYLQLSNLESLQCLPSSLSTISSLESIELIRIPLLKSLPDLPPFLFRLSLVDLNNLDCLPSSLPSLSSLETLHIIRVPKLQELPDLPSSIRSLYFNKLESLQSLPSSLTSLSSLTCLSIHKVPQLQLLPNIPASLKSLSLEELQSLQCLPSSLTAISSLTDLLLRSIPLLKSLPDLPPSLHEIYIEEFDNLDCLPSSLPRLSSLDKICIEKVPMLRELPDLPSSLPQLHLKSLDSLQFLPSSLTSLSSIEILRVEKVPRLQLLQNIPVFLKRLELVELESLQCLPSSLLTSSSLLYLKLESIPLLKSLPNLPPSLRKLKLRNLHKLDLLPSCLSSLSFLAELHIDRVPQLHKLPFLPPCLISLSITHCDPKLTKRYEKFSGSEWHKIAHIPRVCISNAEDQP